MNPTTLAPDFVLVHGAFSDASVWSPLLPALQKAGVVVRVVTLPGHTPAERDVAGSVTLARYVERVREVVAAAERPVVLVGHSLGGMTISRVAEAMPEKIAALLYLCAFLPEDGRSASSYSQTDTNSAFAAHFKPDPAKGVGTISRDDLRAAIFNETDPAIANAALEGLMPEPLEPFAATVALGDRFESVPRYYVRTTRDHAVTTSLQSEMIAKRPCVRVYDVPGDHMPMFSATDAVVAALLDVAERTTATASATA